MQLLFSLGRNDFRVDTFRAGGPGGQNQNKRSTGVRIVHKASGAIGEARDSRTYEQNRKNAFQRMYESNKFQTWLRIEVARITEASFNDHDAIECMRTYNFKRGEVKDHSTGEIFNLRKTLDGER